MMISDSGSSIDAMLRSASSFSSHFGMNGGALPSGGGVSPNLNPGNPMDQPPKFEAMDPMQNQLCRVCEEPAAGFHFGAFTCEGCKSFFGRTCNNQSVIQECKNNYRCVVDKKNRTACKACRLRKCIMVGMSKSGSRYGRRSNWFKIHCLMQQNLGGGNPGALAAAAVARSRNKGAKEKTHSSPPPPPTPPTSQPNQHLMNPLINNNNNNISRSLDNGDDNELIDVSCHSPPRDPPSPPSGLLPNLPHSSPLKGLIRPPSRSSSNASPKSLADAASPSIGHPPPLLSHPGFLLSPFSKQPLLNPLLANSPFWQVAAAARHPFLSIRPPEHLDLLAEHKALMERFAAANMAAAALSAREAALDPPPSPVLIPQASPMDLTKKSPMEIFLQNASKLSSSLKAADLNRNNLFTNERNSDEEIEK